ncbi:MAG: hypothetical protein WDO06_00220 [Actinomycetota bacterium]
MTGAHQQLQMKLQPELSFSTWQEGVLDGGVALVAGRRSVNVEIFGSSRIAILLYGILLASGFSQTTIHIKSARTVSDLDLSAGFLRPADVGLPINSRLTEVTKELSLFPNFTSHKGSMEGEGQVKKEGRVERIALAIGKAPSELIQQWMSQGVPHLIIDAPDGPSLTVGPLVIPGKTPCLRCVAMSKEDNHEAWKDIAWQKTK